MVKYLFYSQLLYKLTFLLPPPFAYASLSSARSTMSSIGIELPILFYIVPLVSLARDVIRLTEGADKLCGTSAISLHVCCVTLWRARPCTPLCRGRIMTHSLTAYSLMARRLYSHSRRNRTLLKDHERVRS